MDTQDLTENEICAAKSEKHFTACDLLEELKPLLEDYFIGGFNIVGGIIEAEFLNGQKFMLTAEEAA